MPDPADLADRQLVLDRERTSRFPNLFTRKLQRMSTSPLAFLRGAAPLFYELMKERPDLADGPPGEGWIVGDLHLENFGAYRPDPTAKGAAKIAAVFNLNDFDDTLIAPWRFDVLRLTTSLLLGGRELGASGFVALELVDRLLESWARSAFDGAPLPAEPPPVKALVEQVRSRSKTALLDARTKLHGGKRRFVRGPRYAELDEETLDAVPKAFEDYVAGLPKDIRKDKKAFSIKDAAFRIAGTGSLGGLRIAVLVAGKGDTSGMWIFDMKEQGDPSASLLLGTPDMVPAERVATGFRQAVDRPARMIGCTHLKKMSMFVRRLAPQEDKLDLRSLKPGDLPALATYLGALLGAAHARAATKVPHRWSRSDLGELRERAIHLAGIHEAVYLALCDRMREVLPPTAVTA